MSAGAALRIRATFGEQWELLEIPAAPDESIGSLKSRVLEACRLPAERAEDYEVKVGGALVRDESASLATAGLVDGSALVILSRRRRPVR